MANIIKISVSGDYTNGSVRDVIPTQSITLTLSSQALYTNLWNVGTTEESLSFPVADVTTEGYAYILNSDDTNYCQIGFATGVYPIRLPPGAFLVAHLDPSITAIYAKANTAATKLLIKVYGN